MKHIETSKIIGIIKTIVTLQMNKEPINKRLWKKDYPNFSLHYVRLSH